jgi:hypothetical protein
MQGESEGNLRRGFLQEELGRTPLPYGFLSHTLWDAALDTFIYAALGIF